MTGGRRNIPASIPESNSPRKLTLTSNASFPSKVSSNQASLVPSGAFVPLKCKTTEEKTHLKVENPPADGPELVQGGDLSPHTNLQPGSPPTSRLRSQPSSRFGGLATSRRCDPNAPLSVLLKCLLGMRRSVTDHQFPANQSKRVSANRLPMQSVSPAGLEPRKQRPAKL